LPTETRKSSRRDSALPHKKHQRGFHKIQTERGHCWWEFFSGVQRMKCSSHNSLTHSFWFCVHNKDMKDWTQQKYSSAKDMCKSVHIPNRINEALFKPETPDVDSRRDTSSQTQHPEA